MKAETFQSSPSPLCLPISNHDEPLKLESIIGLRDERSLTVPTVESLTKRQASLPSMSSQRSAPRCRSSPPTTACHKRCSSLLYLLLLLALVHCASCRGPKVNATYQRTPYIRSKVKLDVPTFRGEGVRYTVNETLNFVGTTMLSRWGETENIILVGSSNGVYMLEADQISEPNVLYSERLQFPPETEIYNECVETHSRQIKRCKNYIKEMFLDNEGQLRVCGTHAMSKQCRFYQRSTFDVSEDRVQSVFTKKEFCFQNNDKTNPCSDPFKETVSIQVADPNSEKPQYFSAIHKRDSGPMFSSTEATTYKSWFSYPTFVKILEYGKKVYVFFRESAENSEVGPRDTQTKYARVAQACKDDGNINSIWSTFRKARLFCNVQQAMTDTALVYDVLQSVSDIHQVVLNPGEDPTAVVFATFTTPNTWFGMKPSSAVCMYTIEEIDRVFEGSKFFADSSDNGYRKFPVDPPLRIENCDYSGREDEIKRNSPFFEFLEQHSSLVVDEVRPKYDRAIFVSPDDTKVTAIAVNKVGDSEVVVYLGTSKGTVLRILPFTSRNFAMFLEEMDFVGNKECGDGGEYSDFCRVKAIEIIPQNVSGPANLLVAFEDEVKFSSCATCTLHFTRIMCENDPECMFVSSENKCQPIIAQSRATSESVDKIDQSETHPGQGLPSSAGISSKLIFFFFGALIGVGVTAITCFLYKRKRKAKKDLYSPTKVSLSAVRQKQEENSESFHEATDRSLSREADPILVSFENEGVIDLHSSGTEFESSSVQKNKDLNIGIIVDVREDLTEKTDERRKEQVNEELSSPKLTVNQSVPLIREVAPKLPPKKKHLIAESFNTSPSGISNSSNNSNNNNNTSSSILYPDTLSSDRSFARPPPIRPKMGVARYNSHSFRNDQVPRIKPKIAPKPVLRSKSFQNRSTFSTSDLHPTSSTSEALLNDDSSQKLNLLE